MNSHLSEFVLDSFERKKRVLTTCCDLSKAFDCVTHNTARKLAFYGFDDNSTKFLEPYNPVYRC